MKTKSGILNILLALLLFLTATAFADADKVEHDNSKLSVFLQPAISFIGFEERKYFQNTIDTIYREFYSQALTESESLMVAKQDFQKVNFCFPISAGLQFQPFQDHFLSLGLAFIYDKESVVLTDRRNKTHNYDYTIQGVPLFLEYRFGIPKNLMNLTGESLFSLAFRWYWVLKGTEIYSTWGKIEAEKPAYGAGFGISLGYLITSWRSINVYGDIGYSTISVKSKDSFAKIVPNGPEGKAKWDIGGLQLQVRVSFGVINNPKVENDSTIAKKDTSKTVADSSAKTIADSTAKPAKDTAKVDTAKTDSSKVTADTVKTDSAATQPAPDTTKTPADTSAKESSPVAKTDTVSEAAPATNTADNAKAAENPSATNSAEQPAKAVTDAKAVSDSVQTQTLPPAKKAVGP